MTEAPACTFCSKQDDDPSYGVMWSERMEAFLCFDCAQLEPPPRPADKPRPDLFERPVDRALQQLRALCAEYELETPYKLVPGQGNDPDVWLCRCPLHPSAGHTLTLVDRGQAEPGLVCRVGCAKQAIRGVLFPDREREATAAARAAVLVWGQRYAQRRAG